jgi:hypothetical protein
MTATNVQTIDEAKLEAFVGQALVDMGAAISGLLLHIGDRLGFYKVMAGAGPITSSLALDVYDMSFTLGSFAGTSHRVNYGHTAATSRPIARIAGAASGEIRTHSGMPAKSVLGHPGRDLGTGALPLPKSTSVQVSATIAGVGRRRCDGSIDRVGCGCRDAVAPA